MAVLSAGPARIHIPDPLLGMIIPVFVGVENQGLWTETFEVSAFYDTTLIKSTVWDLQAGEEEWFSFSWDLETLPNGVYTISANVSVLPGETDIADNHFVNGEVLKTIFADVTGDGIVDVFDLFDLSKAYESTTPPTDLNSDGIVNITDWYIMLVAYGTSLGSPNWHTHAWNPYADLDGDGYIGSADAWVLAGSIGHTGSPNWNPYADMNADNEIGLPDLVELSKNYGKTE
jgi:hypothetical protein